MKLGIPVVPQVKFGIPCPRPEILLEIRTRTGDFLPIRFILDTGNDITTLAALRAARYDIPFELGESNKVRFQGSTGGGVGYLGAVVVRVFGHEHTWPCCFTEPLPGPSPSPIVRR
jgi:hypothetical protein